jgi:hypothetical protein
VTTPDGVGVELERVVRRWQQLPLDRALAASPGLRALVQELADETAGAQGIEPARVPDLGPAVLPDQLLVMVHDYRQAGLDQARLAERVTALRRALP